MIIDNKLSKYGLDETIIKYFSSKTKKKNKEIKAATFIRYIDGDVTFHLMLETGLMTLTLSINKIRNYKITKLLE